MAILYVPTLLSCEYYLPYKRPKRKIGHFNTFICSKGGDFPKHHRLVVSFATFKTRVSRFGLKVGQTGPNGTNPGLFQIKVQYIFTRWAQYVLFFFQNKVRICSIWSESDIPLFDLDLDRVRDREYGVPTIKDMNENPGVIKWIVYQINLRSFCRVIRDCKHYY